MTSTMFQVLRNYFCLTIFTFSVQDIHSTIICSRICWFLHSRSVEQFINSVFRHSFYNLLLLFIMGRRYEVWHSIMRHISMRAAAENFYCFNLSIQGKVCALRRVCGTDYSWPCCPLGSDLSSLSDVTSTPSTGSPIWSMLANTSPQFL